MIAIIISVCLLILEYWIIQPLSSKYKLPSLLGFPINIYKDITIKLLSIFLVISIIFYFSSTENGHNNKETLDNFATSIIKDNEDYALIIVESNTNIDIITIDEQEYTSLPLYIIHNSGSRKSRISAKKDGNIIGTKDFYIRDGFFNIINIKYFDEKQFNEYNVNDISHELIDMNSAIHTNSSDEKDIDIIAHDKTKIYVKIYSDKKFICQINGSVSLKAHNFIYDTRPPELIVLDPCRYNGSTVMNEYQELSFLGFTINEKKQIKIINHNFNYKNYINGPNIYITDKDITITP